MGLARGTTLQSAQQPQSPSTIAYDYTCLSPENSVMAPILNPPPNALSNNVSPVLIHPGVSPSSFSTTDSSSSSRPKSCPEPLPLFSPPFRGCEASRSSATVRDAGRIHLLTSLINSLAKGIWFNLSFQAKSAGEAVMTSAAVYRPAMKVSACDRYDTKNICSCRPTFTACAHVLWTQTDRVERE